MESMMDKEEGIKYTCKAGLQAKGTLVFGLPGKTHYDKGALLLRELDAIPVDGQW
jgi:hypothetical protein